MTFHPERRQRRSIRLRGYDYTQAGAYFITICSRTRTCVFADICDRTVRLTPVGEVAASCWEAIPDHFPTAELDAFVIMPNHLHGIVVLESDPEGTACRVFLARRLGPLPPGRMPSVWQSNYHEHIIRNERALDRLRT